MKPRHPRGAVRLSLPCPGLACAVLASATLLPSSPAWAQLRVDRNFSVSGSDTSPPAAIPNAATGTPAPPASAPKPTAKPRANGAYTANAMGPSIVANHADYVSTFAITSVVPPGSSITNVRWRYSLPDKPPGFEAILCWHNQAPCWSVTDTNIGSTQAFNGKDASQPFTLHYRITAAGPFNTPLQGQMNQLVVSYDLP